MIYLIGLGALALIFGASQLIVRRTLYEPARYPAGWWDQQAELGAQDVWLRAGDGVQLHAWWMEAPGSRLVSLYLHGTGGNVSLRPGHLREMVAAGTSVLILDWRGYGRSQGRPSERGFYRDADAAYDYLIARGFRPEQIVLHGESIGSAVTADLASRRPCLAVVLECPFTSLADMAARTLPVVGPLLARGFDTRRKIAQVHVPVLVIHGDDDRRIPYAIGRAVYEAANQPKSFWTVEGARHLTIVQVAGDRYRERLQAFYDSIGAAGPAA